MTRLDRCLRRRLSLLVALAIVACAAPTVPVSQPSPTPLPLREPSIALRVVAVDGLTLRHAPPGEEPLDVVPATLRGGELVWVLDTIQGGGGPLSLVVADREVVDHELPFGWIPAELDGAPTLHEPELACPSEPLRVADVIGLGRLGGLACFAGAEIELIGFAPVACGIGGSSREGTPNWLNGTWSGVPVADAVPLPNAELPTISVFVAPPGDFGSDCGAPARHRFTAHFDDAASATCRTTDATDDGLVTLDRRVSALMCRTRLVITDAQPSRGG